MHLSHGDMRSVLDAINILTSEDDPASLPFRTNDCVRSLISTDVLSFEGFGTDNDYQGPLWFTPAGSVSNDLLKVIADHVNEQPFLDDIINKRIGRARRVSDYMPLREYKKLTLYNEFFRKIDTDMQMSGALHISRDLMVTVSLCRLKQDFTDRDCTVFDLLTPHLVSAFRNAQFINRLKFEAEQLEVALEATRYGVVTFDRYFQMQIESPTASRLFRKYFGTNSDAVPDDLSRYVKYHLPKFHNDEFYLPPVPLEISYQDSKLRITISFHSTSRTTVLLLEEIRHRTSSSFVGLRLTEREATVLFWISKGKTDGEIALLLRISVRTVQKHVENIFTKLGVETRTAAVGMFLG